MPYSVYSFADVSMTISHPSVGQYISESGEGLGSIAVSRATDNTVHDLSADGAVMVSKIKGRNGTIAITIQQISNLNKWLLKWFNYLETAATDQWADTKVVIRSPVMQDLITALGVSPQKPAEKPYQAQGQNISWALMAADIQQD